MACSTHPVQLTPASWAGEQVQSDKDGVTLCSASSDVLDSMQCNDGYVCGPLTADQVYSSAGAGTSSDGSVLFNGAACTHTRHLPATSLLRL